MDEAESKRFREAIERCHVRLPADRGIDPVALVVSRVRVERQPDADTVTVWSHGALAGSLVFKRGDGETIARALMPDAKVEASE